TQPPRAVVVRHRQPPLGIVAAETDQRLVKLAREEQEAEELAARRVGPCTDRVTERREIARAQQRLNALEVLTEHFRGQQANGQPITRRHEDVRDRLALAAAPADLILAREG